MKSLKNEGIKAAQFMHEKLPWRMPFLHLRNHKKLLIVDGRISFTGGLNLGIENTSNLGRRPSVNDTHFFVAGPVVEQMMKSFAADWHFTTGEMLSGDIWWPESQSEGAVVARGITSGPDEEYGRIETALIAAISQARQRIRIVTPYFLPDEKLTSAINQAALRGVKIEFVIPSISDHVTMDWAMRAHLANFQLERLNCFRMAPPFDHSKLVTVDGKWGAFGSPNWDVRSLRLNFELLLEVYGKSVVSEIDALIDEKIARSARLTLDQIVHRSTLVNLRDAGARLFLPYL